MNRIPIRNTQSGRQTKPRLFDALICDDQILLEVKCGKEYETITLDDVIRQINAATNGGSTTQTPTS